MPNAYKPLSGVSSAVSDNLIEYLYDIACDMESIVEIGSWHGRSAHAFLSACKGTVWCVDHFQGSVAEGDATHNKNGKSEFLKNCGHFENLKLLEMYSDKASEMFEDNSIDMVFIDAGHLHDEVTSDLRCWFPKAKKLICGHDWQMNPVRQAIHDFGIKPEHKFNEFWYVRKDQANVGEEREEGDLHVEH